MSLQPSALVPFCGHSGKHDEALCEHVPIQPKTAELQYEAVVEREKDEVVELPWFALINILQKVHSDTGNEVLVCMEVCKEWYAAVEVAASKLILHGPRRLSAALLRVSKFEGLRTLYLKNCLWSDRSKSHNFSWSDSSESNTLAFQALGRQCPHLTAIHIINVELSTEDAASLLCHCRTICTLELTNIMQHKFQLPPLDYLTSLQSLTLSTFCNGSAYPFLHTLTRLTKLVLNAEHLDRPYPPTHTLSLLQSLDLTGFNQLQTLTLSGSPFLQHLNVSKCHRLEAVDLTCTPTLQSLTLTHCTKLREIVGLETLTSLRTFEVSGCCRLDPWTKLPSIQNLEEAAFDVEDDDQIWELRALPRLRHLNLEIELNKVWLEPLSRIEELSLSLLYLDDLPRLSDLPGLRTLRASAIYHMEEVEEISTLRQLEIRHSLIQSLPQLKHLTLLQRIEISNCDLLWEVPLLDSLANLTKLAVFSCSNLENLAALDGIPNLQHLDVVLCRRLQSLPPIVHLHRLTHLNVDGCERLTSLPTPPHSLQTLKFTRCKSLAELPSLGPLVHLQRLEGSYSGITKLPPLSGLISLRVLYLDRCKDLTVVPELGGVLSMRHLNVSDCEKLERLPPLGTLRRLRWVAITGCPCLTSLEFLERVCEETVVVDKYI